MTQLPIALSSAEAEYYSMVEGAVKAIGLRTMLGELGVAHAGPVMLFSDSSAARAFAARRGLGRMRHVDTRTLWLQAAVQKQTIELGRVLGRENPADMLTKYLAASDLRDHLSRLGTVWKRPVS